ncbi:MAG: DUF4352 domain-containing protein [Lachnospiraceae bacterium]|jgi:hypothetical protein|nr:DUF4352 domain-containing protein [Lachnospiraceae bacterium]MCH4029969.1 DUF4352 domain-containing protein [Lachnospiraceae bacterium]MCH4070370.1 DUF4352 domain-containing protein [Lachnospiraceae bacterium]MCI1331597.1 DUF4352 domain-containing protein [Lachnospiraceae bacterium]MCI1361024.1 DUF4352 domain-containing protein [Lachnospiraceae bacterium]
MRKWAGKAALGAVLVAFAAMAAGSGSSGSGTASKVGEVTTADATQETTQEEQTTEQKDVYQVGDVIKDGGLQIVYVASGEYQEDNEFMQPADGNKLIFLKFAFENQGSSDQSVSCYSFNCYADGYQADQHYTEESLSATISSGRSADGIVIFEVPADAQDIEVEYTANVITDRKIKFAYEGEQDSGYVAEADTASSENAFSVGDIVESKNLNITYLSCENDTSYSEYMAPDEGTHYVTLQFEFENKGSSDAYISAYDFDCYADGKSCDQKYFRDDLLSSTLSSGHKAQGSVSFQVPDDASTVEVEYRSNYWTSSHVIFTVTE